MSDHSQAELEDRLWKEIEKARYGMLGLVGQTPAHHFQPMSAFCERDGGQIWFFSRTDTDLAQEVQGEADAMFVVQAKDQGFQACVAGRLSQTNPLAFGFQIVKANMTGHQPDVGGSAPVSLDHRVGNTL